MLRWWKSCKQGACIRNAGCGAFVVSNTETIPRSVWRRRFWSLYTFQSEESKTALKEILYLACQTQVKVLLCRKILVDIVFCNCLSSSTVIAWSRCFANALPTSSKSKRCSTLARLLPSTCLFCRPKRLRVACTQGVHKRAFYSPRFELLPGEPLPCDALLQLLHDRPSSALRPPPALVADGLNNDAFAQIADEDAVFGQPARIWSGSTDVITARRSSEPTSLRQKMFEMRFLVF